jgi:cell division transport system permease protein
MSENASENASEDDRRTAGPDAGPDTEPGPASRSWSGIALHPGRPRVLHRVTAMLRHAVSIATRRPRAAVWTTLALACALFVAGGAVIAAIAIDRWAAAHPGAGASMVVYLSNGPGDGIDDARATALVHELSQLRGVTRAELVPPTESAARLTRALGADPALLDGVELASLPASIEVRLAPGVRDVVAMSPALRALRQTPGVVDVVVEDGGGDPLAGELATARTIAWAGAAVFAALALIIALAAVRIGLDRPEREAAVLSLLGASPTFVAIPSALAGAVHGVCAAGLSALALVLVVQKSRLPLAAIELAAPYASLAIALVGLIALGGVIGLVGGGLAGVARAR